MILMMHKMLEESAAAPCRLRAFQSLYGMAVADHQWNTDLLWWCVSLWPSLEPLCSFHKGFSILPQARGTGRAWQLPPPLPPTTVAWLSHEHSGFSGHNSLL